MRSIHYNMILSGPYHIDCGYNIFRYNPVRESESIKCPGIRMIIEETDADDEAFYETFCYEDESKHRRPKTEQQIWQALCGEPSEWKLATVDIGSFWLMLGFTNERLFDKYIDKRRKCEEWNDLHWRNRKTNPPCFYYERLQTWGCGIEARLRFEVDNPTTNQTSITVVSFRQEQKNTVIEFEGNRARTFTFKRVECESDKYPEYPVSVEEWMI